MNRGNNSVLGAICILAILVFITGYVGTVASPWFSETFSETKEKEDTTEAEQISEPVEETVEEIPANHFETIDLNDVTVNEAIFADYDVTIVDYWATYCHYCKDDMPLLEEYKSTLPKNVNLIGAASVIDKNEDGSRTERDDEGTLEAAKTVVKEAKITYNTIVANDSFKDAMGLTIRIFPTYFFVDSKGNVIENSLIDGFDSEEIDSMLTEYLETGAIAEAHYSEEYAKELESQPIPYNIDDEIKLVDGTTIVVMADLEGNLIGIPKELQSEFYTKQFQIGEVITEDEFNSWLDDIKRDIPRK